LILSGLIFAAGVRPGRAAMVVASCAAFSAGAFAVLRPDLMMIEDVEFQGFRNADPATLRHLADVRNGMSPWHVDTAQVVQNVERHPWVKSADARWASTTELVVVVSEFEPAAVLHWNRLLYVDEQGLPFLEADSAALDFPQITGITPELESRHPDLPRLAVRNALWLVDELDLRGVLPRQELSEIAFSTSRGFTLHTGPSRVVFAHGNLERQTDRLAQLVAHRGVDLSHPTYIDLGPAEVAIVRPMAQNPQL